MRLKVIMPVISSRWNESVKKLYEAFADFGTEVIVVNLEKGAESIECEYDEEIAASYVIKEAKKAQEDGFDAIVVFCFGNTAVCGAREAVDIPVVGIGEVAELIAMSLGDRFSILSTIKNSAPRHRRKALAMGTSSKLASIRPLDIPVLNEDPDALEKALLREGRKAIEEDGADVIILGCGTMSGVEKRLERELCVPVVNSGVAGLKWAEMLVRMGLAHSKKAYFTPPAKRRIVD